MDIAEPGTILAGKYQVQRLLGMGGMGVVVAARDLASSMLVAVKFILPFRKPSDSALKRFIREARILSMLRNENLATVFDSGVLENGMPYFAMEYIEGLDLSALITLHAPLALADAADLLSQVCHCIADVHRHGLVHRDLKPENLRITLRVDGSILIKVIDFGLSKVLSGELGNYLLSQQTNTGGTLGTPAYMPPEQARSANVADQRSDIWSMGAILYHMLSGKLPFPAKSVGEAIAKVILGTPAPLRSVAPWLSEAAEAMVMRCLEKQPERRYQTAHELGLALHPFTSAGRSQGQGWLPAFPGESQGPARLDLGALLEQRLAGATGEDDAYGWWENTPTRSLTASPQRLRLASADGALNDANEPDAGETVRMAAAQKDEPDAGETVRMAAAQMDQLQRQSLMIGQVENAIGVIPECIQDIQEAIAAASTAATVKACERLCKHAYLVGAEHLAHLGEVVRELAYAGMLGLCGGFVEEMEQEFHSVFQSLLAMTQERSR